MKSYKNKIEKLLIHFGAKYSSKRVLSVAALLIAILPLCALSQTSDEIPTPAVDYHIHIQSLKMSKHLTPEQPTVDKLPEEFERLCEPKEVGARVKMSGSYRLYTKVLGFRIRPPVCRAGKSPRLCILRTSIARLVPTARNERFIGDIPLRTDFARRRNRLQFLYTL